MRWANLASSTSALTLSAAAPAAMFVLLTKEVGTAIVVFAVSIAHALLLGLPLYLALRKRELVSFFTTLLGGFLVGSLPIAVVTFPLLGFVPDQASVNGVPTVVDGVTTLAGWLEYFASSAYFGAFGSLSGLAFWLIARSAGLLNAESVPNLDSTSFESNVVAGRRNSRARERVLWASAIATTFGILIAIPELTADRTCHNVFRDGRTTIEASSTIRIKISPDQWSRLAAATAKFAEAHHLSFRDSSEHRPNVMTTLYLSLCSENGFAIDTVNQRWINSPWPTPTSNQVEFHVYVTVPDSNWRTPANDFAAYLSESWPGAVEIGPAP